MLESWPSQPPFHLLFARHLHGEMSSSPSSNVQPSVPSLPSDFAHWPPHVLHQAIAMLATRFPSQLPSHGPGTNGTDTGPPIDPALLPRAPSQPPPLNLSGQSDPSAARNKRSQPGVDMGSEADSEGEVSAPPAKRSRRSQKPPSARTPRKLLCDVPTENLTDQQLEIRRDLQVRLSSIQVMQAFPSLIWPGRNWYGCRCNRVRGSQPQSSQIQRRLTRCRMISVYALMTTPTRRSSHARRVSFTMSNRYDLHIIRSTIVTSCVLKCTHRNRILRNAHLPTRASCSRRRT